jgi:hypothetical protein
MMVPSMTAVRIVKKDQVIFACARLAFITIDEDVFRLGRLLGNERTTSYPPRSPRRRDRAGLLAFISLMIQSESCARHFLTAS